MKKRQFQLIILLIFAAALAGCGPLSTGGEEAHRPEPINIADWPTPAPTVPTPTPTLFPRVTPPAASAAEEAPAPGPTATPIAAPAAGAPAAEPAGSGSGLPEDLTSVRQIGGLPSLSSDLVPVAVGLAAGQTEVRQGPGASFGPVQTLEQGNLVGILGRDAGSGWVYVITLNRSLGWLSVEALRITGDLAEAPVLPANPLAALAQQAPGAPPAAVPQSGDNAAASREAVRSIPFSNLAPVTQARVTSALLNMRQRPGPDYQVLDTLSQDEVVTVLAVNQDRLWALVETADSQYGWVYGEFLDFEQSIANAPRLRTLEPTPANSNEAAPVAPLSGSAETIAIEASSNGSDPGLAIIPAAAPAGNADSSPASPGNTLSPVASALMNTKIDSRRGPGDSYGAVDELTVDEPVDILARNEAGDWVVVRPPSGSVGWVPLDRLKMIEGNFENAAPVVTAWVESNETKIYSGPGVFYGASGLLAIYDVVSVLGLNEGRNWALVEATNGGRGWVPLRLIQVSGSLADLPEVAAPPVAQGDPAGQALPAPDASSATTGKLVFQTSSGGDIMIVNADGSGLRRLTSGIDPVLSPDGRQVAFTRWVGDIGELWTINVDGSNERQILGAMRKAKGPVWSPDSSQIALNFQRGGQVDEVQKCQAIGEGPNPPRNASNIRVVINDKGEPKLCWVEPPDPHWTLRVINVADASFEDLYGGVYAFRPAWDPSQPWRVVSDAGNGLLAVSVEADDYQQQLTDIIGDGSPVFSPDGRYIAVSTRLQGEHAIFRLNSDGSGRIRLTQTPLWAPVQADSDGKLWNNVSPTWSPDGALIAFLTDRNDRWEIWVMNADGSDQRPLFPDEINAQIKISYEFVDERALDWR